MPQLINRCDWRMVKSQSLGNHDQTFSNGKRSGERTGQGCIKECPCITDKRSLVLDHTSKDAPVCDAASRVGATIVTELRVHAASNVF
ncbi:hypothetical protein TNCV_3609321 [Trichonephila clavipes]|nr:hypothetical protein TNCV_3609321 [Trichonephila clavipes]